MAKAAGIIITGIAIVLLVIYGADVAASANVDGEKGDGLLPLDDICLLYTSPSPRDATLSRMPSSA